MKKIIGILLLLLLCVSASAQKQIFKGAVTDTGTVSTESEWLTLRNHRDISTADFKGLIGLSLKIETDEAGGASEDSVIYFIIYDLDDVGTFVGDTIVWTQMTDQTASQTTTLYIQPHTDDGKQWFWISDPTEYSVNGIPFKRIKIRRKVVGEVGHTAAFNETLLLYVY